METSVLLRAVHISVISNNLRWKSLQSTFQQQHRQSLKQAILNKIDVLAAVSFSQNESFH